MARSCMFCGATSSLSEEHVFPRWLLNELRSAGFEVSSTRPVRSVIVNSPTGNYGDVNSGHYPMSPHGLVLTRKVCLGCNRGWMAGLESEFAPVFKLLVRGRTNEISHPDVRRLLAHWALKTCMAHDASVGTGLHYRQAERVSLMSGVLPSNTDVRMTFNSGAGAVTGVDSAVMRFGVGPDGQDVLGVMEVLHAGPLMFLVRRADQGNAFVDLISSTEYFARRWMPVFALSDSRGGEMLTVEEVGAFLNNPYNVDLG